MKVRTQGAFYRIDLKTLPKFITGNRAFLDFGQFSIKAFKIIL